MTDVINELAAEAANRLGGTAYTYGALDALNARIILVEEGGSAFPRGQDIGNPDTLETNSSPWSTLLPDAGWEPGMYSWWNAIPCGLDRKATAEDKAAASSYLRRALGLHADLHIVIAVGTVAQTVVAAARTSLTVLETRSPKRASREEREDIVDLLVRARKDAYPFGYEPDRA